MCSQCALIAGKSQAKESCNKDSRVEWESESTIDLVHLVRMGPECASNSTRHSTTGQPHHTGGKLPPTPTTAHALLSLIILLLNLCIAHPRLKAYGNIGQIKMRYYKSKLDYQAYNALVGDSIALPCNITPPSSDDGVSLILWYRDDLSSPIYTVDSRLTFHLHAAKHFMDTSVLADRASFNITYPVSYLRFNHVVESDTAEYRCRVDFRRGRTINRVMQLNVIVPTKRISIYDSKHNSINDIAGPFNEDSSLNLTCESEGGHPPPVVRWWKGDVLLSGQKTSQHKSNAHSVITFDPLQREHLMMPLTCEALNNNLTEPVTKTILIDLILKPTEVRIIEPLSNMTADQRVELVCQSSGSRPPARIFWKKNQKLLEHYSESTSDDGSVTTNFVTFTPSQEDNGKLLTCTAYNPQFSDYQVKATIKLNVHYAPILSLLLGASVQRQEIVEGSSIYFDCNIQANPQIHQFGWLFDGNELVERDNDQIEIRNNSIIIRNVNKDHIGAYQCYASNPLGKAVSEVVNLNVKYTPRCVGDEDVYYKVEPYTELTIECGVHAEPSNVSFLWQFNSSLVSDKSDLEVHHPELVIENSGTSSVVRFVPHSPRDYGTLQCLAENRIGRQKRPCTFHITKSELPDAPQNCSLSNITVTSLTVQCAASHQSLGTDSPHRYVLQIFKDHNQLIRNVTAEEVPRFQVADLPAGFDLSLFVYAVNRNGASEKVRIVASTLVGEPRKLEHIEQKINIKPFILLILFTALLLILTTVFLVLFLLKLRNKYKAKHRKKRNKISSSVFDTETSNITTTPVASANPNVSAYSLQMRSCSATGEAAVDSGEIITLGELAPPQLASSNSGSPLVPVINHMPTGPELLAQSYLELTSLEEMMPSEAHLSQCAPIINYAGSDHVAICSETALPTNGELVYLAQMHTTSIGGTRSINGISHNTANQEPFFANYIALDHAPIEKSCGLGRSDALGTACILLRDGLQADTEVKSPTPPPLPLQTAQLAARIEPKTPAKVRFSE